MNIAIIVACLISLAWLITMLPVLIQGGEIVYMREPKRIFIVLTFGAASILCRGVFETLSEAEEKALEIRGQNGDPKIYEGVSILSDFL